MREINAAPRVELPLGALPGGARRRRPFASTSFVIAHNHPGRLPPSAPHPRNRPPPCGLAADLLGIDTRLHPACAARARGRAIVPSSLRSRRVAWRPRARAPCPPISTMCWRSCRSGGRAARSGGPLHLWAIPLSERSGDLRPDEQETPRLAGPRRARLPAPGRRAHEFWPFSLAIARTGGAGRRTWSCRRWAPLVDRCAPRPPWPTARTGANPAKRSRFASPARPWRSRHRPARLAVAGVPMDGVQISALELSRRAG